MLKTVLLTAMSLIREDRSRTCSLAERSSTPSRWSLSFILFKVFIISSFSWVLVSHSRSFFSSLASSSMWSKLIQWSRYLLKLCMHPIPKQLELEPEPISISGCIKVLILIDWPINVNFWQWSLKWGYINVKRIYAMEEDYFSDSSVLKLGLSKEN